MFDKEVYAKRRQTLCEKIGGGLILLPGNVEAPMSYDGNSFPFRQDSTFLYYFGLDMPNLVGLLDADTGDVTLCGNDIGIDDLIWTGPQPTVRELGESVGVSRTKPLAELSACVKGRRVHYLPPYQAEINILLADLLGMRTGEVFAGKSVELMFAVAVMREKKEACEIEELREAFHIGYEMHATAMRLCREGVRENEIIAAVDAVPKRMGGWGVSFPSIVTTHGETLHHHQGCSPLESGRLLLVDAGGERASHYCSDHTRTYPVSGRFTDRQRDIYNIVLKAHDTVPEILRPGMMYADLHRAACTILAEGLHDVGLLKCSAEDAVSAGIIGELFMPHGLGHGIGLDVHDFQAIGERSFDYGEFIERAKATATCAHRATWRLNPSTVLSDEPGIYFIPDLIDKLRSEGRFKGMVDYELLESYKDFGGVRIEDDLLVTETGCEVIGDRRIPSTVEELENVLRG